MTLEKFSSQADPKLLQALKEQAKAEGKALQVLVNEAFADLIAKKQHGKIRPAVLSLMEGSLTQYESVYRALAQ